MPPKELPPQTGEVMMTKGAVVAFGPGYLENTLQLIKESKGALENGLVLSCERIDDLIIPDGPVHNCLMIFFHRKPAHMDPGAWDTALLQGVDLRAFPPRRLGVADRTPEEPTVELVPAGDEMQLIVSWLRPLESAHIVRTARAIERSYVEHGGQYGHPDAA
jgi:hypothetical protein